jgi:hypothetical protein
MKLNKIIAIASAVGALCTMHVKGATANLTTTGWGTNNLLSAAAYITSFTIANPTAATLNFRIFDSAGTNLTWTNSTFTNFTTYASNTFLSIFTNIVGVVTTNTNSVVYSIATTNTVQTGSYRTILALAVPANTTTTWEPVDGTVAGFGLCVTNNTNINITVNYSNIR